MKLKEAGDKGTAFVVIGLKINSKSIESKSPGYETGASCNAGSIMI